MNIKTSSPLQSSRKQAGIAIVTFRRPDLLDLCLSRIAEYTTEPHYIIVTSDDNEDVETRNVCAKWGVTLVTGANRGVARNKNRALLYFMQKTKCDPIVLLEDDTSPTKGGWLERWTRAAQRWHHVNFSRADLLRIPPGVVRGSGEPDDPHVLTVVTGQCTAVTRRAVEEAGYLSPAFRGYGYGHAEWSLRHGRRMYDPTLFALAPGKYVYLSISSALEDRQAPTFRTETDVGRNSHVFAEMMKQSPDYCDPWQNAEEEREVLAEVSNAGVPPLENFEQRKATPKKQQGFGSLDTVVIRGATAAFRGWALSHYLRTADRIEVSFDGHILSGPPFRRALRPDVVRAVVGAPEDAGFEFRVALSQLPASAIGARAVVGRVYFADGTPPLRLPLSRDFRWSSSDAILARDRLADQLAGKNLYFGNLPVDEPQYRSGSFLGLALHVSSPRDVLQDAYDPLPVPSGSVAKVQSQDVFEHLEYERVPAVLDEVFRVLQTGGIFRLSVPDYRSPPLRARTVYDENGNPIADLMMGMSVQYDASTKGRKITVLENGDSHLWFPTYDNVRALIDQSNIKNSSNITFYHYWKNDEAFVCNPYPDLGMQVKRSPPMDMRAGGRPVSIIVDFVK